MEPASTSGTSINFRRLHGSITQIKVNFTLAAVRTSVLKYLNILDFHVLAWEVHVTRK
jgi:hypothetical protein